MSDADLIELIITRMVYTGAGLFVLWVIVSLAKVMYRYYRDNRPMASYRPTHDQRNKQDAFRRIISGRLR